MVCLFTFWEVSHDAQMFQFWHNLRIFYFVICFLYVLYKKALYIGKPVLCFGNWANKPAFTKRMPSIFLHCLPFQIFRVEHLWVLLCRESLLPLCFPFSFCVSHFPYCHTHQFAFVWSPSLKCTSHWVPITMFNSYSSVNICCMSALGEPGAFFLYSPKDHNTQKAVRQKGIWNHTIHATECSPHDQSYKQGQK